MASLDAQVITVAHNPETGEERTFADPGDVPDEWVRGEAPNNETNPRDGRNPEGNGNKPDPEDVANNPAFRLVKAAVVGYALWKLWGRFR